MRTLRFRLSFLLLPLIFLINAGLQPPEKTFTVVINAGHGGTDPGCHGTVHWEKDVALSIALKLGAMIESELPDVKVEYTRKTDVFVPLNEIAAHANRHNPDLFICIHCNASTNKEVYGSETYVMGLHKTKGNLEVARRENASILYEDDYKSKYEGFDPNSPEASIIFSMYQDVFLDRSLSFAAKVQDQFEKIGRENKGVKQAGFLVLWKTKMPAVLIETGFLTNPTEEKYLGSARGQEEIARSIYNAFVKYKKESQGEPEKEEAKKPAPAPADTLKNPPTDALWFGVQLLSSSKKIPLTSKRLKGLTPVREINEENAFKYICGPFYNLDQAVEEQKRIREAGFPDAFLVAYHKQQKISLKEARAILSNTPNP